MGRMISNFPMANFAVSARAISCRKCESYSLLSIVLLDSDRRHEKSSLSRLSRTDDSKSRSFDIIGRTVLEMCIAIGMLLRERERERERDAMIQNTPRLRDLV